MAAPHFGPIAKPVPPTPGSGYTGKTSLICTILVARAGIEPATFRFSDGMKSGTYPFALVRLDQLDQQVVVEPLILRLTADNRRINSTPPRGSIRCNIRVSG